MTVLIRGKAAPSDLKGSTLPGGKSPHLTSGALNVANVIDVINQANADQADAQAKGRAAIDANGAAKAAGDKADASRTAEANVLAKTGEVFIRNPDGTIATYDCPDGKNIVTRSPQDAASLPVPADQPPAPAPEPAPAQAPAPAAPANPATPAAAPANPATPAPIPGA